MRAFSFVHCADVHLGAALRGLDRLPEALKERVRGAQGRAFGRLVSEAIDHDVDAIVIAGDLFDGADRNLRAQVRLREHLERLDDARIPSFLVAGNHDPLGSLAAGIRYPDSVHVFGPEPEGVPLRRDDEILATVYGASYPTASVYRDVAAAFPASPDGPFSIGVLHTNVGDRPGHAPYAPTTLESLRRGKYDYWGLGHVHGRETLNAKSPVIHYPGSLQGLHSGETGPHGATLVRVSSSGSVKLQPLWVDVVRWHRVRTPIDELESMEELIGAFAELSGTARGEAPDRTHLVHWTLTGHGPLHRELVRPGAAEDLRDGLRDRELDGSGDGIVWLQRLDVITRPVRHIERLREQQDYVGDLLRLADGVRDWIPSSPTNEVGDDREDGEAPAHDALRSALAPLLDEKRLARALGDDPWSLLNWRNLVGRAEALVVDQLAPDEGE